MGHHHRERRKYQRVTIIDPIRGRAGDTRIVLSNVSLNGLHVLHQAELPRKGGSCAVSFEWHGQGVELECTVRWTEVHTPAKSQFDKTIHQSGLHVVRFHGESREVIRELIERHVLRALDERKANARGLPAVAAQSFQTGKADALVRHEFIGGQWQTIETKDPRQPLNGFTISVGETPASVQTLRDAFAQGDQHARHMIQKMAAMSISRSEGIPTRRYEP
ncbi:MAG: PilZ domain-containing protein [Acidobacteria bacterium]|nr:PilZ domain-containing protein [Acidobacteriota bacterium]MBV9475109.1 PilZ domain-containing protein [Acidobacteriota bacterium]